MLIRGAAQRARRSPRSAPPWSPVGTRAGVNGVYGSSNEVGEYVFLQSTTGHHLPYGAEELRVCYAGFHVAMDRTEFPARARCFFVDGLELLDGGAGYLVGDVLTLAAPKTMQAAAAMAIGVEDGAITHVMLLERGVYGELARDPDIVARGGAGAGARLGVRWSALACAARIKLEPAFAPLGDAHLAPPGEIEVEVGGLAISDPVAFDLRPRAAVGLSYLGTYGGSGRLTLADGEFASGRTGFAPGQLDQAFCPRAVEAPFTQPLGLLGRPKIVGPSVVILGDGLVNGSTGTGRDDCSPTGEIGWAEKALGVCVPWSNFACDGDFLSRWAGPSGAAKMRLQAIRAMGFSAALVALGLNDFGGDASFEDIRELERDLIARLRAHGVDCVIGVTITPVSGSTDKWTSLEGQWLSKISPRISLRNERIRAGDYGLDFDVFVDVAAACESPEHPGKWRPGSTADGYHPNAAALADMASLARRALRELWSEVAWD